MVRQLTFRWGFLMVKKMNRIYHTWEMWECFRAGFFDTSSKNKSLTDDDCRKQYADFLKNSFAFQTSAIRVITEWPVSTEHNLTNENMNRLAWIGQAAACIECGLPSKYCGGFNLLSNSDRAIANNVALGVLNAWLATRKEEIVTLDTVKSKTEANMY